MSRIGPDKWPLLCMAIMHKHIISNTSTRLNLMLQQKDVLVGESSGLLLENLQPWVARELIFYLDKGHTVKWCHHQAKRDLLYVCRTAFLTYPTTCFAFQHRQRPSQVLVYQLFKENLKTAQPNILNVLLLSGLRFFFNSSYNVCMCTNAKQII